MWPLASIVSALTPGPAGSGYKRYTHVVIGEKQATAEHQIVAGGQGGGAHVPRQQRMVRYRPGLPVICDTLTLGDRGREMSVIEKGGIRGESLLTHKLL